MPKPCGHTESRAGCRICLLTATRPDYARLYDVPFRSCRYQGEATGERVLCPSCTGHVELKLFACEVHGSCTLRRQVPGIACCQHGCTDSEPVQLTEQLPELWPGLPDPLCEPVLSGNLNDWARKPRVRERHVKAFQSLVSLELPVLPGQGDGVVVCGGGRYWAGAVVAARMLRRRSKLPIQIWYRGASEPIEPSDLDGVSDVTLVDSTRYAARIHGGWESKTIALLHCGFERVLFLDADAYPVEDPALLLESVSSRLPFAFWVDLPHTDSNVKWYWHGLSGARGVAPIQGGQLVLHRSGFSRELLLAHWINQHSDYFYRHQYGDQDSWRVALASTGGPYRVLGPATWGDAAFVCRYQQGERSSAIVHRCGSKMFRESMPAPRLSLPCESEAMELFHQPCGGGPIEVFGRIYHSGGWGGRNKSGEGSTPQRAADYLDLLTGMFQLSQPGTVVDLGSGDGYITAQLQHRLREQQVLTTAVAVDCHEPLVQQCRNDYPDICWLCHDLDAERDQLPCGDVALLKDVLGHWPSAMVSDWLDWAARSGKWRKLILTYDRASAEVMDVPLGSWRPLVWDQAPLRRPGLRRLGTCAEKEVAILDLSPAT